MMMRTGMITAFLCLAVAGRTAAQQKDPLVFESDSLMLTVVLKHQQDKPLDSIQAISFKNKFYEIFPPQEARVVSWYVMMGLGQVVTLKFPARYLRKVNMGIEKGAWGSFNTEIYATYDYQPIWLEMKKSVSEKK